MCSTDTDGDDDAFISALTASLSLAKEQDKDPALWVLNEALHQDPFHLFRKH